MSRLSAALLIVLALTFTLTACGDESDTDFDTAAVTVDETADLTDNAFVIEDIALQIVELYNDEIENEMFGLDDPNAVPDPEDAVTAYTVELAKLKKADAFNNRMDPGAPNNQGDDYEDATTAAYLDKLYLDKKTDDDAVKADPGAPNNQGDDYEDATTAAYLDKLYLDKKTDDDAVKADPNAPNAYDDPNEDAVTANWKATYYFNIKKNLQGPKASASNDTNSMAGDSTAPSNTAPKAMTKTEFVVVIKEYAIECPMPEDAINFTAPNTFADYEIRIYLPKGDEMVEVYNQDGMNANTNLTDDQMEELEGLIATLLGQYGQPNMDDAC
jgi:hypothetical protein